MDEKSKATIEKMLLEEQQYLSGKSSKPRRSLQQSKGRVLSSPGKSENNVIPTARRLWSDQEKQMLLKGMVIVFFFLYTYIYEKKLYSETSTDGRLSATATSL